MVNVSSPNTPGLRGLQELDLLEPLLAAVLAEAGPTPLLVKIAPDLDDDAVRHIGALVGRLGLAGVVATNTTIRRDGLRTPAATVEAMGAGGLSGPPVAARSLEILRRPPRGAAGGGAASSASGEWPPPPTSAPASHAGADLVQGYTAFLYRGPGWAVAPRVAA